MIYITFKLDQMYHAVLFETTGAPSIIQIPLWIAQAMGYERLYVLRGRFSGKFRFGGAQVVGEEYEL